MTQPDPHSGIRRLPGGIPIPVLVIGLPALALLGVAAFTWTRPPAVQAATATPVRSADLILQDHDDGSIAVLQAPDDHVVDVLPPASNAFLRVMLTGLVRERRREGEGSPQIPFHLTRWSDGRLTIDDLATHRLIELNAFGPDNAGAFSRLLDLSRQPPPA